MQDDDLPDDNFDPGVHLDGRRLWWTGRDGTEHCDYVNTDTKENDNAEEQTDETDPL